jgi:hypothetical protein
MSLAKGSGLGSVTATEPSLTAWLPGWGSRGRLHSEKGWAAAMGS